MPAGGAAIIGAATSGSPTLGVIALDPQQPESAEPTPESPAAPKPAAAPEPAAEPTPGPKAAPSGPKTKARKPKPPGLGEQLGKTGRAAAALAKAHVDLAKAEASEIGREGGRLAGLVAAAVGLVLIAVILAIIGTSLFLGEWLLGSLGWGVLHGVLLFVTLAVALVLWGLRVEPVRIARALAVGVVVAVLTSVILGLGLANQSYARIGESIGLAVDPASRPLILGMALGAIVGLILVIIIAARATAPNWFVAIAGGIVLGVVVGVFTSISFGFQIGTGIGITGGYLTWVGLMGLDVSRTGIDVDGLKARFIPTMTIETSKETLEWLKERKPRANGS